MSLGLDRNKIIFGCGNFGGIGSNPKFYGRGDDEENALHILDLAKSKGIFQFDTANSYGGGASELYLGKWLSLQSQSFRSNVKIASKVGNPVGRISNDQSILSQDEILKNIDRSLKRLGTDHIDTYYIHELDPLSPIVETLEGFSKAIAAGKIGGIGLSNVKADDVKIFLNNAGPTLTRSIVRVQNEFNYLVRGDEIELIPLLEKLGISYVAFSPLAGGLLAGKLRHSSTDGRLSMFSEHYKRFYSDEGLAAISELEMHAEMKKVTMAQAALEFILQTRGIAQTIIAPRSSAQFIEMGFTEL